METQGKPKTLHNVNTFYVASAWWEHCDPFVRILGLSPKLVKEAIFESIDEAARDAYDSQDVDEGDPQEQSLDEFRGQICWSGVHPEPRADVVEFIKRHHDRRRIVYDLQESGFAYIDT